MTTLVVRITSLPFLVFLAKLIYPKYNGYCFIIYMLVKYCDILKQRRVLLVRAVSISYMKQLLEDDKNVVWDLDNTVVVNASVERSLVKCIIINSSSGSVKRKVNVITKSFRKDDEALLTHTLHYNLKSATSCFFRDCINKAFEYAEEVELSLINSSTDWSNFVVDTCLRSYFMKPKLLYLGDVIAVSLKEYGIEAFYLTEKLNNVELNLYFKCKSIIFKGKSLDGCLCAADKTVLKQTANIQSFVPKLFHETSVNSTSLQPHPDALGHYFESIKQAIVPFVKLDRHDFLPIFLIEGRKGSGKSLLIKNIASYFGMHLYTVNSFDLSANVYAQNEIKLRNLFSSAKMISPSILQILNFENFGKNNEDEYDERLISSFVDEVETFFVGNKFPAILFCSSNEKTIPANLRRVFLKIFEIKAPDHQGRESLLRWITATEGVKIDETDINKLANRTHGFLYEDLRALVHYAVTNFTKNNPVSDYIPDSYFLKALDFMQTNYNESVGAPKVPQVKWSDVGGLTEVKEEIIKTIKLPLKYPHLLKSNGLKRSGILLFGPPGTGKTLLAKAVATECGLCFLSVKGPELLNMYVGQSEQNVREVFERAREASPCIIFFDELDSLAPNRGGSGDSGGVMDRIVSQLLAEMDGLNQTGTVFIIGATNRPDLIDPALLRPGRFDKLLYVGPCTDRDSKLAVLKALTKRFYLENRTLLEEIVDICPENFSGADYYGVCSMAWMSAVSKLVSSVETVSRNDQTKTKLTPTLENIIVTAEDFKFAVENIKPSITKEDLDYFHSLQSKFK